MQALRITAWYLLLGGGWVLISHGLPSPLHHDDTGTPLFPHVALLPMVAGVALLLYFLARSRLPSMDSDGKGDAAASSRRLGLGMLLGFAVFSTVVFSVSLNIGEKMGSNLKQEKAIELDAIASLKKDMISAWLKERLDDARLFGRDYDIAFHYSRWLSGSGNERNQAELLHQLNDIRNTFDFINVLLLDLHGRRVFNINPGHARLGEATLAQVAQVISSGQPVISRLYRDSENGDVHVDFIAPLLLRKDIQHRPVGVIVLHASAQKVLFPLIRVWPLPSASAETLLVRRDGDRVVFLNPLRHTGNRPLDLSKPIGEESLIAAMALRGEKHVADGVDYRGVPVLAATRHIAGTQWIMVAKVDLAEVYAGLRRQSWVLALFASMLVISAGAALLVYWRQQQHGWLAERLRESQERQALRSHYETVLKYANDIFMLADTDGWIVEANERAVEITGYGREELFAMNARQLRSPSAQATLEAQWQFDEKGSIFETEFQRKDGSTFPVEVSARIIEVEGKKFRQGIIRDISKRKQAEQRQQFFRSLLDSSSDGIEVIDPATYAILDVNETTCRHLGYGREELLSMSVADIDPNFSPELAEEVQNQVRIKGHARFESLHRRKDGSTFPVEVTVSPKEIDRLYLLAMVRDITERKQVEEAIRASRDLLRSVVENIPLRVFWKDRELRYLGCNTAFARDAGMHNPKELYGKDDYQMGWKDVAELYRADDKAVMDSGEAKLGYEEPQTTPDGRTFWLRTSKVPLRKASGEVSGMLGIYQDITDERRAQDALGHLNRALKTLSAVNHSLVHAVDEQQLCQAVCRVAVEVGDYLHAWVGYAQSDEAKSVKVMASHAVKPGYAESIHVSWGDVPEGQGPAGTAIRTGKTQHTQNIADDPIMQPWCEKALAYGYQSCIALPLMENDQAFGVLTIYASEPNAFNKAEIALLEEMAGDLGYGIHMQHIGTERDQSRTEHQQALEQLGKGLEETVQAIAATVEKRDPYTAGHQRRVGELAQAIAVEMGLPEKQIKGIHLAATIHDLGKIHIPAEILSKPGKLTEVEYKLIQQHPQTGYDILKDVSFPWPIAEIILQHHERLDGSGYPQGLKGEQILPEAKIMAVADVVEAMSSHRPYRPGLGLELGLKEIEGKRGKLYEPKVVDACLRLFRDQGYKMPV